LNWKDWTEADAADADDYGDDDDENWRGEIEKRDGRGECESGDKKKKKIERMRKIKRKR
jgi:hypothetical protein